MTTITTQPRETIVFEHTDSGRFLKLKEPAVVAFYATTVAKDVFKEYYERTIVPWLKSQQKKQGYAPDAPYPIEIYLMDSILVVVTEIANYQPWEAISDLREYVTKVNVERLESPLREAH
jgi:hypothetical protein